MTALHALLSGIVDYAGLFPPAALSMEEAVARHVADRAGPHAWMLGRFVVPASRLEELAAALAARPERHVPPSPWPLSVLIGADLLADTAAMRAFTADQRARAAGSAARIEACEVKAASPAEVRRIAAALPPGSAVAYEIPPDSGDRRALIASIAAAGGAAKIRTGAATAAAIPPVEAVEAFITDCLSAGVPFKATAGLHHPVRGVHRLTDDAGSQTALMHGFLNVFAGAVLATASPRVLHAVLDERDPRAFRFEPDALCWRNVRVEIRDVTLARTRVALSFGSCSFDDPVSDLQRLGVLQASPGERWLR